MTSATASPPVSNICPICTFKKHRTSGRLTLPVNATGPVEILPRRTRSLCHKDRHHNVLRQVNDTITGTKHLLLLSQELYHPSSMALEQEPQMSERLLHCPRGRRQPNHPLSKNIHGHWACRISSILPARKALKNKPNNQGQSIVACLHLPQQPHLMHRPLR